MSDRTMVLRSEPSLLPSVRRCRGGGAGRLPDRAGGGSRSRGGSHMAGTRM